MANRDLQRAVELLAAGDWESAHKIVQEESSSLAAWLHGIVHTLGGDLDNARYWYRRAARSEASGSLDEEWTAIASQLLK